jgi:hypothetical protein
MYRGDFKTIKGVLYLRVPGVRPGSRRQLKKYARVVMEEYLGRRMHNYEKVVHKDKNNFNCDIDNLEVEGAIEVTSQKVSKICDKCGKPFTISYFREKSRKGKGYKFSYCSPSCSAKGLQEKYPSPNSGRRVIGDHTIRHNKREGEQRYYRVTLKEGYKWVKLSRYLMGKKLKRPLNPATEVVRFRDGDPLNCNISNLYIEPRKVKKDREKRTPGIDKWAKEVYKKDNYSCQRCGEPKSKGNPLHAHHILPYERYRELRVEISNGITLCARCHMSKEDGFHTKYGKVTFGPKELQEHIDSYVIC